MLRPDIAWKVRGLPVAVIDSSPPPYGCGGSVATALGPDRPELAKARTIPQGSVCCVTEGIGMAAFNRQVITAFRESGGVCELDWVHFDRLVLLTTIGRRSGTQRTVPLRYVREGVGHVLLFASNSGAPQDPDWFRNIAADPHVRVEITGAVWQAEAVILHGDERDEAYRLWIEHTPERGWASAEGWPADPADAYPARLTLWYA